MDKSLHEKSAIIQAWRGFNVCLAEPPLVRKGDVIIPKNMVCYYLFT